MKFRAHETFFIRRGWLSKGMRNVLENPELFITKDADKNPMDVLGIGANMVKSLRYWLRATGLTIEKTKGKRTQELSPFGKLVNQFDPYTEEMGTLMLIHYNLAKNEKEASAWYYLFNKLNLSEFSLDDYVQAIQNYLTTEKVSVAVRSLIDDFNCIINTYVPRFKDPEQSGNEDQQSPENNLDCPLGELGLIELVSSYGKSSIYRKSRPHISQINPWVLLAVIYDNAQGKRQISLNSLLYDPNNIGHIYNLDSASMLDLLYRAERTEMLKIVRTAGLDYVVLKDISENPDKDFEYCVKKYYEEIA